MSQNQNNTDAIMLHEKLTRIAPIGEELTLMEAARRVYNSSEFSEEEKTVILAGGLAFMSQASPSNTTDFFEG
jgi:hypothetical protein